MPGKEYGLILPGKKKESQPLGTRTLNPLLDSGDELEKEEEEESGLNWVESSLKRSAGNSGQKSLQKRLLREALQEDATIFQYDEVYDDIKASRAQELQKQRQPQEKKAKYIETILKHSEKRKLENERRQERKVQKEREAEGGEFADKESYVTPSYLKKLEELKKAAEDERVEQMLEEQNDVHKHKNFGVFYNHLFKQRLREGEIKREPLDADEGAVEGTPPSEQRKKNYRTQRDVREVESPPRSSNGVEVKQELVSPCASEEEEEGKGPPRRGEGAGRGDTSQRRRRSTSRKRSRSADGLRRDGGGSTMASRREGRSSAAPPTGHKDHLRRRSRERVLGGNRSRGRGRSNRSRSRSRDRSRDRSRRSRSRDRGRRRSGSRSKDRYRRRKSRSKSQEKIKEEKDEELEDRKGEILKDGNKRNKNKDKENHAAKSLSSSTKSSSAPDAPSKQSINTTLGSTDVNKMNIEDRLKRFTEIFAKRTVGGAFEDAVRKYFERKAEREGTSGGLNI